MAQKTKKEHYVPQCYLEAWCIPGTHQIHVYDKKTDSYRVNNIADVASERYFYDVSLKDILSEDAINDLRQKGIVLDGEKKSQDIEHAFSEVIEKPLSDLLNSIKEKVKAATPWHINNCYFISDEKKYELCFYLTLQLIRTKRIRNSILETSDHLVHMLNDMGFPDSIIEQNSVSEEAAKNIHVKMLIDSKGLHELMECFWGLTWMLGINRTGKKLFTSDNPIGTYGHIKDPFLPMNGIGSRGVEVFYPISPDIVLTMVDGSYHTYWQPFDRKYIEISENDNIDFYNSILAMGAERFVFSTERNMSLIEEMKQRNHDVFNQPHIQTTWGGKTYDSK